MKYTIFKNYAFSALAAAGLWITIVALSGCGSTPKTIAYKSLASVGETEAAAMRTAADYQVAGKLAPEAWPQIAAAHDKFTPAYGAAVAAARFDYTQPASTTVIVLAQIVADLVTAYLPAK